MVSRAFAYLNCSPGLKRTMDITGASAGLILSAPIQLILAVLVAAKLGRPVFFRQQRPGRGGEVFEIVKFRTMIRPDPTRNVVTNEQRMTRFGSSLRSTSLDELPSLWNVARGEMSLVGPRPLRIEYLDLYTSRQARRHEVRPGLTGLAQISGRNQLSWDERLELDVEYVETCSLLLDFRIMMATFAKVLRKDGVTERGQASMSAFTGSAHPSGLTERQLGEEHLELRVAWLFDDRISGGVSLGFVPDLSTTKAWFSRIQSDASRRDWVYLNASGEPVAMCGLVGVGTQEASLYLYVNPEMQGLGLGRRSMEMLIDRARALGVQVLTLETKSDNERARQLYSRVGFADLGPLDGDSTKHAMVLQVGPPGGNG